MTILVYIDQDDKNAFAHVEQCCTTDLETCNNAKNEFWHGLIEKYPVLKNRRLSVNIADGYIFHWDSNADLLKANLGHV